MTLVKMQIDGYLDESFKSLKGSFVLQVNPTQYSFNFKALVTGSEVKADGTELPKGYIPDQQKLKLNFFLDSTGVIEGCTSVPTSIDEFKKLCTVVDGSVHTTHYLKIHWGDNLGLAFKCKLESLQIDYLMFKASGEPIRAQLSAVFAGFIDPVTKSNEIQNSSPDLSHIRIIKAGDSLTALCHEIYGDPQYYLQVAEVNGILNFRQLVPGQKVLFPRLQK